MNDLSPLLDELHIAINEALGHSDRVLNALAALEGAVGDFRVSIDAVLPDRTDQAGGTNAWPRLSSAGLSIARRCCRAKRRQRSASHS